MVKDILISELAKRDFNVLKVLLENVPFEDAFKNLNGFNLSVESYRKDDDECVIETFFDFNFGCLNGTIFRTKDNMCDLLTFFDVWIDDVNTPIAQVEIDELRNDVDVIVWYLS